MAARINKLLKGAQQINNRHRLSKTERQVVYNKTNGHCAYCGQEIQLREMQVDHIVPLRKGGADDITNMFPSCRSCNRYKSTFTIEQFRQLIQNIPNTLIRDCVTFKNGLRFGVIQTKQQSVKFYFEKQRDKCCRE